MRVDVPTLRCDRCGHTTQDLGEMDKYRGLTGMWDGYQGAHESWDLCQSCWISFVHGFIAMETRPMTDPAVEAAQRASAALDWSGPTEQQSALLVVGAREASKPLRELHFRSEDLECGELCSECLYRWPCATARLIYREDELWAS